ncbi:hypothetical protein GCM10009789_79340 [Kribbella sancticallisti]|uniref:Uncharacterized protein n=1 Tax=Kribbella sancticallisti TaxID=460087 RepID=A0ABN2ERN1_9ACTN
MRDPRTELLTEYVDEQTPDEAPPFEFVERAVRRQRRTRMLAASVAVVVVAGGAAFAATGLPQAEEPAGPAQTIATAAVGLLDDGPPPDQFGLGTTVLRLDKEIPIKAVRVDPERPDVLVVEAARDAQAETCLPHTVARILAQTATTIRVAAYRYTAPDQPEGPQCQKDAVVRISLDLRRDVGARTVLAGSTGHRVVLN